MKQYNKMFNVQQEQKIDEVKEPILKPVQDIISQEPKTVTVISCGKLNVREEPVKGSNIIDIVNSGDILVVMEEVFGWTKVRTKAGIEGYVVNSYIK